MGFERSKNINDIPYEMLYLEHINRILDFMIVYETEKRRNLENVVICIKDARRLIKFGYNAVGESLPQICNYCGDGILRRLQSDKIPIPGTSWLYFACDNCGNIQIFENDFSHIKKWWKEI